jgi:hypothetical protein
LQRIAQIDGSTRAHHLHRQDAPNVVDGAAQLAGRGPSVRHVVLLHRAGGERLHRCGHRQALGFHGHRCLRVVSDHQAAVDPSIGREEGGQAVRTGLVEHAIGSALGDGAQLGCGNREEVTHEAHRCSVEVSAALHSSVEQDHWVVDGGVELSLGDGAGMGHGVERGSVHLRSASQRVRVLNTRVAVAMAGDDGRAGQQPGEVARAHRLTHLGPQGLKVGSEGAVGAEQAFHRHRCRDVGEAGELRQVVQREAQHAEDAIGAVDEGEALLGAEDDGTQAGARECCTRGLDSAVDCPHLTLTDQ